MKKYSVSEAIKLPEFLLFIREAAEVVKSGLEKIALESNNEKKEYFTEKVIGFLDSTFSLSIDYIETVDEVYYSITGEKIEGIVNMGKELKKGFIEFNHAITKELPKDKALNRILLLLVSVEKSEVFREIEEKPPIQWHTTLKKNLKSLENFKLKLTEHNLPPTPIEENTQKIINALEQYKFSEHLKKGNFEPIKIYQLLNKHSGKGIVPYSIALMHETGFLKYFFDQYTKNKNEGFKLLQKVFDHKSDRKIKGNINILNPKSSENPNEFTSASHIETIRKELKGL
jgi:hypothetical protein